MRLNHSRPLLLFTFIFPSSASASTFTSALASNFTSTSFSTSTELSILLLRNASSTQAQSDGTSHSLHVANPEDDGEVIATVALLEIAIRRMTELEVTTDYLEGLGCCFMKLVERMSDAIVELHNRPIGRRCRSRG
ncbi:hypothetical protein EGR_09954 [Echinococcus granulosus]|uniref:Uncharacterized protein n=1 Tax=Echinococcus granulosus TaxID=6210 RepID=W6U3N3_ECHGR|nr:hypothetical protein EGR_09954 [Echinococcus granulosus]EUB55191.1 hypothetical protein EGR_09954 [Echinococcus granulosus]